MRILQEQHRMQTAVCLPERVSGKALADTFIRYSAGNQDQLDKPAAAVVMQALVYAWPCAENDG